MVRISVLFMLGLVVFLNCWFQSSFAYCSSFVIAVFVLFFSTLVRFLFNTDWIVCLVPWAVASLMICSELGTVPWFCFRLCFFCLYPIKEPFRDLFYFF